MQDLNSFRIVLARMSDTEWDSDAEKDHEKDQEKEKEPEEDTREDNGVLIRYCYCSENAKSHAQTMTLPCSHVVHTQCFMNRLMEYRDLPCDVLCLQCNTPVAEPFPRHRLMNDQQARERVITLWATNEQFRTDVDAVLRARKVYTRQYSIYRPQRAAVLRKFKDAIRISIAYIKDQVRSSKAELRAIPGITMFKRADGAFRRKLRALRTAYNVWNLDDLNEVEGGLRVPNNLSKHLYYRRNPFYVRI